MIVQTKTQQLRARVRNLPSATPRRVETSSLAWYVELMKAQALQRETGGRGIGELPKADRTLSDRFAETW